ncbi:MAG: ABC transporter substrate-binding protein [Actinobacteria bacterium]|nr:ABC transporter substrate-binding protein [Actinomycetota bacterium]
MKKTIAGILVALLVVLAVGCSNTGATDTKTTETTVKKEAVKIKIGTLPTEDALPIYVAKQKELFSEVGVDVEVIVFNSAQERDAALQAGRIDGLTGDILAAAVLERGGVPVSIVSVLLGSQPTEGRFGILASPKSEIKAIEDLKGVPIAVSGNTIIEYVVDGILTGNGFADADIEKIEIKKIPVRLEALMSGQTQAAALPDPLLSLAQARGARLIVDDTKGANLSQTILLFGDEFLSENRDAVGDMLEAVNDAVILINVKPDSYRGLLIEKAELPEAIAESYQVNLYPQVQLPTEDDVERLLDWMVKKDIIKAGLTYDDLVNREVQPN